MSKPLMIIESKKEIWVVNEVGGDIRVSASETNNKITIVIYKEE